MLLHSNVGLPQRFNNVSAPGETLLQEQVRKLSPDLDAACSPHCNRRCPLNRLLQHVAVYIWRCADNLATASLQWGARIRKNHDGFSLPSTASRPTCHWCAITATTKLPVSLSATVESCEQHNVAQSRMSPTTKHIPSCLSTSKAGTSSLSL